MNQEDFATMLLLNDRRAAYWEEFHEIPDLMELIPTAKQKGGKHTRRVRRLSKLLLEHPVEVYT